VFGSAGVGLEKDHKGAAACSKKSSFPIFVEAVVPTGRAALKPAERELLDSLLGRRREKFSMLSPVSPLL
jgi:hypothetical protein